MPVPPPAADLPSRRPGAGWRPAACARGLGLALLLGAGLGPAGQAAEAPRPVGVDIFVGADLALGEQLIEEHACEECHARNAGGTGTGIYKPQGRINTPGALRGMVEYCNTQLNLGMFPEEVTAVAAVLQRDFYRFR